MTVTNNNLAVLDLPVWEQMTSAPAGNSGAGVASATDLRGSNRYIYQLYSAASFWRFDTYSCTWQQLASPPGGTVGTGTSLVFDPGYGTTIKGSVWAIIANTAAPVFYNYDISTNTWSTAKSITNLPATIGTDSFMCKADPAYNLNGQNTYSAMSLVTLNAAASAAATTLTVLALPKAIAANTILNFGTANAPIYAIVSANAAQNATSVSVQALATAIPNAAVAPWSDVIYFIGNATTNLYSYSIGLNQWAQTSSGIPAAVGAGNVLAWLPGYDPDKLLILRGGATNSIYQFSMSGTSFGTLTYQPSTDTFTTGTYACPRINPLVTVSGNSTNLSNVSSMQNRLVLQLNATGKFYEFDPIGLAMNSLGTQWLVTDGAAVIGDRMNYIVASGVEFIYYQLHTSATLLRFGLNSQY